MFAGRSSLSKPQRRQGTIDFNKHLFGLSKTGKIARRRKADNGDVAL